MPRRTRTCAAIACRLLRAAACASLLALSVSALAAGAASAPAASLARVSASHSTNAPTGRRRQAGCARRASFKSSSGYHSEPSPPAGRRPSCQRRHTGAKHHSAAHRITGACSDVQLQPSTTNLAQIDAATLCLVNRERTSRGLRALRADADLQHAAQAHSAEMAEHDYFDHVAPSGSTPLTRLRAAGYIFSSHIGYAIGENIAWGTLWLATPKAIVASWMASPGHRANILDAAFRETGVGVSPHPLSSLAHGQSGAIYTQDFGVLIHG